MSELICAVIAVAALSVLIVVHECGHYLAARWCRIRIDRLSLGFGPTVFQRKSRATGTTFRLALIPFGGSVTIQGMDRTKEVAVEDPDAFPNRSVGRRLVTILAGPMASYLSAVALAMTLYTCRGVETNHWYGVARVLEGYDAYGKLDVGDRVIAVDHDPVFMDSGPTMAERVNASNGAPITLTIERDGHTLDVRIRAREDRDHDGNRVWRIGFQPALGQSVEVGLLDAAGRSLVYPIHTTQLIAAGLCDLLLGQIDPDGSRSVRWVGPEALVQAFLVDPATMLKLVMLLSVYVGLFQLLPVPPLDGGRLVHLIRAMLTRPREPGR